MNNCEDTCDRLDCRERGCIGPISTAKEKMIVDIIDKMSKLKEAELLVARAQALLQIDKDKLKELCQGSCVNLIRKKEYYPGGNEFIDTCPVCDYYKGIKIYYE